MMRGSLEFEIQSQGLILGVIESFKRYYDGVMVISVCRDAVAGVPGKVMGLHNF